MTENEIFIYIDDSGVLHSSSQDRFFVYAGYIFRSQRERDSALASYRAAEKELRARMTSDILELKAYLLSAKQKRFLNQRLSYRESMAVVVEEGRMMADIMNDKRSIHRFKDYAIKRLVKEKIKELIVHEQIDPRLPVTIHLFVDNQPTTTNGRYNLKRSIIEEFTHGSTNLHTQTFHPPLFQSTVTLELSYCDSREDVLIRASDLLANSIYYKYNYRPEMHLQSRHCLILRLP